MAEPVRGGGSMVPISAETTKMQKPRYSSSKRHMTISHVCAWAVIFTIVVAACLGSEGARALASTVVPIMATLIAAMLGIHRFSGSLDMRTIAKASAEKPGGS